MGESKQDAVKGHRSRGMEACFRRALERVADVVMVLEGDGTVGYANPAVERWFGYHAEELHGCDIFDYLSREDAERLSEAIAKVSERSEMEFSIGLRFRCLDGSWNGVYGDLVNLAEEPDVRGFILTLRNAYGREPVREDSGGTEALYKALARNASDLVILCNGDSTIRYVSPSVRSVMGYEPEELVDADALDYIHPDDADRVMSALDECAGGERRVSGPMEFRFRHADGSWRWLEAIGSDLTDKPSVGGMVINARDVTERKQAEAGLKRNLSMLLAIHEANRTLSSTLEVEEIASRLLEIMQRVSDLGAAGVYMVSGEGWGRAERTVGSSELWDRATKAPESILARESVLREERPVSFRISPRDHEAEPTVGMCIPLKTRNNVVGVLEAYGSESLAEDDTAEILVSLAGQAASALENARLYEQLGEREQKLQDLVGKLLSAQEEERRRVAYEVHDGLAQVAVAAHQHLQVFARRHHWGRPKSQADLERILKLVRSTVTESRRIIANLRPTVLDDLGLASAIALEVENLRDFGYWVDFEEKLGDERLPLPAEIALFRVTQEALTNMRKHAQTERVCIKLWRQDGWAYAEVRDWGRGFDPAKSLVGEGPGERIGLSGMRERVVLLGGDFDIRSRPGAGTAVVAGIPL